MKHGMPEKYSVLINKKNKGGDSVKKNRKRKRTKKVDKRTTKYLMDKLQDRIDKRTKAPTLDNVSVYEDERKYDK